MGSDTAELRDVFHNDSRNLERGSGGRERGVAHMDCGWTMYDQEIIHEAAVGAQGLQEDGMPYMP